MSIFIFIGGIFAILAAFCAIAIEIMEMAGQDIAVFFGKLALQAFDARIENFLNPAAFEANKMIVVAIGMGDFIAGYIVRELDFGSDAGIAKQFQCAVNRGLANARIFCGDVAIKLIKGMVPGKLEKGFRYNLALGSRVQATTAHELQKCVQRWFVFHKSPGILNGGDANAAPPRILIPYLP